MGVRADNTLAFKRKMRLALSLYPFLAALTTVLRVFARGRRSGDAVKWKKRLEGTAFIDKDS